MAPRMMITNRGSEPMPKMKDILAGIKDQNLTGPEAYGPPMVRATAAVEQANSVEEAVAEQVAEVLVQDPALKLDTVDVISDHFIRRGENIAREMELNAEHHDEKAKEFRQLAKEARETGQIQAKAAAAHEDRMKQIENLLKP